MAIKQNKTTTIKNFGDATKAVLRGKRKKNEVAQSCPTLCNPMDCMVYQASLSMGFSRQEYWNGLPFPSPVYSYTILPQEIRKTLNIQPNFTPKATGKRTKTHQN